MVVGMISPEKQTGILHSYPTDKRATLLYTAGKIKPVEKMR